MASGYEKSPQYSGPESTRWGTLLVTLFVTISDGLFVYLRVI